MDTFTVYLFVRGSSHGQSPRAIARRLQALHNLSEELVALGNVRVTALPDEADLQVEVTNVIALDGEARAGMRRHSERVLIIRLLIANEPVEFVCCDGVGNMPAERHAARRVLVWLHNLTAYQNRPAGQVYGGMTVSLSTN